MKKFLLSLALIASYVLYVFDQRGAFNDGRSIITPAGISQVTTDPTPVPTLPLPSAIPPTPGPNPTPTPTPVPVGQYKNGQYTGIVADAFYGPLQVQAIISKGKITDIKFLQFPNDRSTSVMISKEATPILKQEAIQIQSSKVDNVSGATQTSNAFRQTLESALAKAK